MSESEEDELAAMRRERLERLGKHGGSTLVRVDCYFCLI